MTRLDAAREAHNEAGMALADAQSERTYGLSATRAMQALSHSLRVQGFLIDELAAQGPRRVSCLEEYCARNAFTWAETEKGAL